MNVISKRFTVSENHSKSLILEYFLRLLTKQLFLNFPAKIQSSYKYFRFFLGAKHDILGKAFNLKLEILLDGLNILKLA